MFLTENHTERSNLHVQWTFYHKYAKLQASDTLSKRSNTGILERRVPKTRIAQKVGIARSTLYAELERGTVTQKNSDLTKRREYFADTGQLVYEQNRKVSRKSYKADAVSDFLRHIEKAVLDDKLSPMQFAVGRSWRVSFP